MRHSKARLQLNRFTSWRKATVASLVRALFIHQKITTTLARAKAARPLAEKLISLGKKDTLFARRQAYKILGDHQLVSALFKDIAARFTKRTGGYTRILGLGKRRGDSAEMAVLSLTEIKEEAKKHRVRKKAGEIKPGAKEELPAKEQPVTEEKKPKAETPEKEKPPITQKPTKKFLGGLRGIFKRERDSL